MRPIPGQTIEVSPFGELVKEADLIYYDGPLLSLYSSGSGDLYLYYWCDADSEVNRWIVSRVLQDRVNRYLRRRMTLRELLLSPADGFCYVNDISSNLETVRLSIVDPGDLPDSYRPGEQSYHEFDVDQVEVDVRGIARTLGSSVLDLHLAEGDKVGFGTVDSVVLGTMLRSTGDLTADIAETLFFRESKRSRISRAQARSYGEFDFVLHKAASFSAILRPRVTQSSLPFDDNRTTEVVRGALELLTAATSYQRFKDVAQKYDDAVLESLERLVTNVRDQRVTLDLSWADIDTGRLDRTSINPRSADALLANLHQLTADESRDLPLEGMFEGLNVKLRRYSFAANDGTRTSGQFHKQLAYPVTLLNFATVYRIVVRRRTTRVAGRIKPQRDDLILEVDPLRPVRSASTTPELE
jgi:hypothetical protein